jgi:dolichyl-diphosphooligosaccharide--protein glycosyltransferase
MGYHGRYEPGDFDYAGRSYGVLSWWDYGHWITERARRPAVANPFQQNAEEAALYFTAESEAEAGRALEALNGTAGERVRYVVVDDRTVAGKFGAVAVWAGEDPASYTDGASFSERHGRTMAARLYLGDASGLSHHRLVHESRTRSILAGVETAAGAPVRGKSRTPASQARAVRRSSTYRLVDPARHSTVKVFERVPGARLEYEGPAVVSLGVETNTGREFTYRNSGNGSVTVPYASIDEPYRVNFTDGGTAVAWVNETEVRDGATVDVDR